ncbi:MAG: hypothetical protein QXY75_04950, partial [Candidatus Bathyarchaeia archaeon]
MLMIVHHAGEPYGLLGPQLAASYISRYIIPTSVLGVSNFYERQSLVEFLQYYYRGTEPIVAFSHICGKRDLMDLMKLLKSLGFRIILGGPQADRDFLGEPYRDTFPYRIEGLQNVVDLCFSGPIEALEEKVFWEGQGLFRYPWTKKPYLQVDWHNLYFFSDRLYKLEVKTAQVLRG